MLVLKELADNALDESIGIPESEVELGCTDGRYFVRDYGRGMGAPENVAQLFSIKRPLISTKLLRSPPVALWAMGFVSWQGQCSPLEVHFSSPPATAG